MSVRNVITDTRFQRCFPDTHDPLGFCGRRQVVLSPGKSTPQGAAHGRAPGVPATAKGRFESLLTVQLPNPEIFFVFFFFFLNLEGNFQ